MIGSINISLHRCTGIEIETTMPDNSNMIELTVTTRNWEGNISKTGITFYGLPEATTDALIEALGMKGKSND